MNIIWLVVMLSISIYETQTRKKLSMYHQVAKEAGRMCASLLTVTKDTVLIKSKNKQPVGHISIKAYLMSLRHVHLL